MKLSLLNVFQLCSFLKIFGNFMVIIVLTIIGLSIYTVVIDTCIPKLLSDNLGEAIAYGFITTFYLFIMFMLLWSYFAAAVTDPGRVPDGWHPYLDDETAQRELQLIMTNRSVRQDRSDPRRPRYCYKCNKWKPERAHHCSVSRRCILKMDHYCIWIVNCVGLLNYKFFLLFLIYTWIGSLVSVLILLPSLIKFFTESESAGTILVFLSFVIDAAFLVTLLGFIGMHLKLLGVNCSSIEMYEKQRANPWPYDKGFWQNIEEVFGTQRYLWPFPFYTNAEKQRLLDLVIQPRLVIDVRSSENVN